MTAVSASIQIEDIFVKEPSGDTFSHARIQCHVEPTCVREEQWTVVCRDPRAGNNSCRYHASRNYLLLSPGNVLPNTPIILLAKEKNGILP